MSLISVAPPAIIFINNDLSDNIRELIVRQLFIDQVMDGYVFDDVVAANPNFPEDFKKSNSRLLVIRSFRERENREYADVVVFFKNGLVSVEKNKFGPPMNTFEVRNLHWGQLGIWIKKKGPGCLPNNCCGGCTKPNPCKPCGGGCATANCGCDCACSCKCKPLIRANRGV